MKANELRSKASAELQESLLELRKEQFKLRMQQGTGQLQKPSQMRQVRRDIARIKTILHEKVGG